MPVVFCNKTNETSCVGKWGAKVWRMFCEFDFLFRDRVGVVCKFTEQKCCLSVFFFFQLSITLDFQFVSWSILKSQVRSFDMDSCFMLHSFYWSLLWMQVQAGYLRQSGLVCDSCNNFSAVVLLILVLHFTWFVEVVCTVNERHFLPHRQDQEGGKQVCVFTLTVPFYIECNHVASILVCSPSLLLFYRAGQVF